MTRTSADSDGRAADAARDSAMAGGKERSLHVRVPEQAHYQARVAALASRMPFKVFMARLMLGAEPILQGNCAETAQARAVATGVPESEVPA
jgi:hypothetical protein